MSHRYVALLRGINVGGRNKLPMAQLSAIFERQGCTNVRTLIQSGNVVFDVDAPLPAQFGDESGEEFGDTLAGAIHNECGFLPQVLILAAVDFLVAARSHPWAGEEGKTVHLFFLAQTPPAPDLDRIDALKAQTESFHLGGRLACLHAPDGIGRSKLASAVERCLGVAATARNLNTVAKLVEMVES